MATALFTELASPPEVIVAYFLIVVNVVVLALFLIIVGVLSVPVIILMSL